jgi:hypothetical protein
MSHELGLPKRREFRLELAESRRIVPEWTSIRTLGHRRGSRGGLELVDPPGDPPSLVAPKADPPWTPPRIIKVPSPEATGHELGRFGRWCIRGLNAPFHALFRETTFGEIEQDQALSSLAHGSYCGASCLCASNPPRDLAEVREQSMPGKFPAFLLS